MRGMDAATGRPLDGIGHLRQSIADILATPIGTRAHRREYGSRIPSLIDNPMNPATMADLRHAAAEALGRWEPRFGLRRVVLVSAQPGRVVMDLEGTYRPDGRTIALEGIVV